MAGDIAFDKTADKLGHDLEILKKKYQSALSGLNPTSTKIFGL